MLTVTYSNTPIIQQRPFPPASGKELLSVRVINHPMLNLIFMGNSNRYSKMRETMDKIPRPIDRVDNPLIIIPFLLSAFFAYNSVRGVGFMDNGDNFPLYPLINFCHKVVGAFFGDFDGIQP